MPTDTKPSKPVSDTTSANEASRQTEAAFLGDEAAAARASIEATIAEMRESLKDAADIRAWTERYPWASLGVASAAGFIVARMLLPKRGGAEQRDPALLERILADEAIAERIKEIAAEEEVRGSKAGGMLQSVGSTLLRTFGPAIQSAISTALAARAAAPDVDEVAEAARKAQVEEPAEATD